MVMVINLPCLRQKKSRNKESTLIPGGTVGGLMAAYLAQGKFKSVASVIMNDLTIAQKERLCDSVRVSSFVFVVLEVLVHFTLNLTTTGN